MGDGYPVLESCKSPVRVLDRIMGISQWVVGLAAADCDAVAGQNLQQRQDSTSSDLTCQVGLPVEA